MTASSADRGPIAPTMEYPQLDLLRSVAVCLVVLDHTAFAFGRSTLWRFDVGTLGLRGVWMFFVHTSLVLMWSLERRPYALDFYIRRFFRIYPLAIAATLAVCVFHAPLSRGLIPYFGSRPYSFGNVLANLSLMFNLGSNFTGYFAILHVEWTLPWEAQMYLVLPVLFAFVRRERTFWTLLALWALASAVGLGSGEIPVLSFPGSIPDFLAGVIAYLGFMRFRPRIPSWLFPLFVVALLWVPLRSSLHGSYLMTLLLGLGLPFFRQFKQPLSRYVTQRIARYSYGIYLTHPFGLWIAFVLLHLQRPAARIAVMIVATWSLSVLAYHALERPMVNLGARVAARVERIAVSRGADRAIGA